MKESDAREILSKVLLEEWRGDDESGPVRVVDFEAAGVTSDQPGFMLRMSDGTRFLVTVSKYHGKKVHRYRDFDLAEVRNGIHLYALTDKAFALATAHRFTGQHGRAPKGDTEGWCGLMTHFTLSGAQRVVDHIWDDRPHAAAEKEKADG